MQDKISMEYVLKGLCPQHPTESNSSELFSVEVFCLTCILPTQPLTLCYQDQKNPMYWDNIVA